MDFNKNYYSILGLNKNSTQEDIKKSFRKKANETHPDKHGGKDEEFKKINEAYQTIGDKKNKQEYDAKSPHGKSYNPSNFNSMFGNFGGGGFNFSFDRGDGFDPFEMFFNRKKEFYENLDIKKDIRINLKDIYNNKKVKIRYQRNVSCNSCNGTGFDQDSASDECTVCDGGGKTWEPTTGYIKCRYCQGSGEIHSGTCKKCKGDKVIIKDEEFQLSNVYRIDRNDSKYLGGYGHQSKHYRNKVGNLILNIIYEHNDKYLRKGDGLYCKMDVHFDDAIKGKKLKYEHLDDKEYELNIPENTKDGDTLRMKSMGLILDGGIRQHLYFLINIIIDYDKV